MNKSTNENEEFATHFYQLIITDSNNWDLMNGRELNRRLTAFNKEKTPETLTGIFSCLRLADIYYIKKREAQGWATLVSEDPETGKKYLFVFSTQKHIPKDMFGKNQIGKMSFREFLDDFKGKADVIVLNADTSPFTVPIDEVDKSFSLMDEIEMDVDTKMEEGIAAEDLTDIIFERFCGRDLYCELKNGSSFKGECFTFHIEKDEMILGIQTEQGENIDLKREDVSYIKSLLFEDKK